MKCKFPGDELARQIGEAAYKVTDEQVAKVVEQTGSGQEPPPMIFVMVKSGGISLPLLSGCRYTPVRRE
jgi:hypothetical protein